MLHDSSFREEFEYAMIFSTCDDNFDMNLILFLDFMIKKKSDVVVLELIVETYCHHYKHITI